MKYIVMECFPSYAVLLDEEGRFLKPPTFITRWGRPCLIRF